jgi:hypothetical protein
MNITVEVYAYPLQVQQFPLFYEGMFRKSNIFAKKLLHCIKTLCIKPRSRFKALHRSFSSFELNRRKAVLFYMQKIKRGRQSCDCRPCSSQRAA